MNKKNYEIVDSTGKLEKAIEQVVSYSRIYGDTTVDRLDEEDVDNLVYFFKNCV